MCLTIFRRALSISTTNPTTSDLFGVLPEILRVGKVFVAELTDVAHILLNRVLV